MDLSNGPAGMYLVNIFTGKRTYTSKLLITK
ncbi:MAG: T9SS type A sorting domain-containing protein [Sphingobacteriales bacterium JAD_PAG50586_3]|nr:MAG: T9SS type A sorting domain-containing protein [Sphingobacteriales bacterium JAD_PAG50586_3]